MPVKPSRNTDLFNRLIEGKLSPDEIEELVQWLGADKPDDEAAKLIAAQLKQTNLSVQQLDSDIIAKLERRLPLILQESKSKRTGVVSIFRQKWMRYAAVFLLFAGLGYYLFLMNRSGRTNPADPAEQLVTADEIQPGRQGAILTLVDGSKVLLDSVKDGLITMQNGTKVMLRKGQLVYDDGQASPADAVYNIMSTPKGRQFQLVLPDGSKVWLNAASSIRYPTVFSGKERKVEITGEAYFEVVPNKTSPFLVKVNEETEIEVLGTHFNVNSYENEESINTTLLEGSVKIKSNTDGIILKPGQQARSSKQEKVKVVEDVDIEKVMAWKDGVFNFQDATLQEVMRQLERWYDIDVQYEKNVPKVEFFGKMGRDLNLATVLRGLEKSNVRFRMEEGRKLVVLP